MPRVTALSTDRSGRHVLVELDGSPWRRVPTEVAVRAALATDAELGRADLRRLRRELRRAEALDLAARALRHRDRSEATVRARLEAAGVAPWAREQALEVLARAGVVDDTRFARTRAEQLAARGSGDAVIHADLLAAGVEETVAAGAVDALEPEPERARQVVARRGESLTTARWLARRGFSHESVEAALPRLVADEG